MKDKQIPKTGTEPLLHRISRVLVHIFGGLGRCSPNKFEVCISVVTCPTCCHHIAWWFSGLYKIYIIVHNHINDYNILDYFLLVYKEMNIMHRKESLILIDNDEDDRLLFSIARDMIDTEIDLIMFRDGEELVQYMKTEPEAPSMLFLEFNMQRMSGLRCLKEIRNLDGWKDVPVAMYTMSANETDIHNSNEGGAQVYIKKPNCINVLAEMIKWTMNTDWKNTVLHPDEFFISESTWKKAS